MCHHLPVFLYMGDLLLVVVFFYLVIGSFFWLPVKFYVLLLFSFIGAAKGFNTLRLASKLKFSFV